MIPTGLYSGVIDFANNLFGSLAPLILLIFGVIFGLFVFELVIGIVAKIAREKIEASRLQETELVRAFKILKTDPVDLPPAGRKAVILGARFKEVMKGQGISVKTK